MLNAVKVRLYPTDAQRQSLACQFGCARWVWNDALVTTQELYRSTGKGLTFAAMSIRLPKLKQEFEWLHEADSQALQQSLQNLARAFENFFAKRAGYPNFKSKYDPQAMQYPQRVKVEAMRLHFPKLGWVKAVVHRAIVGKIKTVTLSRNACGQYHASILTNDDEAMPALSTEGRAIGIDAGLTHLAITSNGSKFENPRHVRKAARNLKRKQQSLSRKVKGSKRRDKARQLVARVHHRVACARKDYLHKLSRRIVSENQVIAVEDLNVAGMIRNRSLAKSIGDAGWGMFRVFLEYKAARAGKAFVKCDRWFPSSKACSACGRVCERLPLDIRRWTCTGCGASHDRDVNAAMNIRAEGLRVLAGGAPASASGGNVSRRAWSSPGKARLPKKLEVSS